MKSKLLIIFISVIFSINTYAERIMGHSLPEKDLLALGQLKTQFRLCTDCESKWHTNAENIKLREHSNRITKQQALTLLINRTHPTVYVGLGAETGTVYYINFGHIEGPFDNLLTEVPGGTNHE